MIAVFDARYWNLLRQFTVSWFKLRDQGSFLGFLWTLLHPMLLLLVLYTIFVNRLGNDIPHFGVYLLIGIIHWSFFATATTRCVTSLVSRDALVRNASFPNELLVFSDVGCILISFVLEIGVLVLFLLVEGLPVRLIWFALPLIVAVQTLLVGGVSLLLASAQVYTQDVERIWSIVLRVGFFMVPIFYSPASVESPVARFALQANPLTQIMTFSRDVLIDGRLPSMLWMLYTLVFGAVLFGVGTTIFRRIESSLAERV